MSIDKYIRLATAGMPRKKRIEQSAELRSNILARRQQLQDEGFSKQEAEDLAIDELGSPVVVNRRFLGHVFTHRLGWQVLGFLVLLVAAWLVTDQFLRPVRVQHLRVTDIGIDQLLRNPTRFLVTLPRDAGDVFIELSGALGRGPLQVTGTDLTESTAGFKVLRERIEIIPGELETANPDCETTPEEVSLLVLAGRPGSKLSQKPTCSLAPAGYTHGVWQPVEDVLVMDTWVPIAVFVPTIEEERRNPGNTSDTYSIKRLAPEDSWVVLSLWVGNEVAAPDKDTHSPDITYLRDKYFGVFLQLDEQEGRR